MDNLCTVSRRQLIRVHHLNLATGDAKLISEFWTTQPCSIPLRTKKERETGICKICRSGHESEHDVFANEAERLRATQS